VILKKESRSSMRQDLSLSYTSSLVAIIEHEVGRSLELRVREAFLQVPRHAFLQRYYEGRVVRTAPPLSDKAEWHTWLASMYRDQALTTEIDERGLPTSSSSQPSVMAALLEELSTQPGHTILEIGTGTGYNAALLATLVGDPHLITTVDINPALVDAAHRSIEHIVGPGVSIHTWNGIDGYAPHAPYDRIIATGSYLPIPQAWIAQLKPEGKLVMDLRGHLSGGLLTLTKHTDGTATGAFLSKWQHIGFMQLRSPQNAFASPPSIQGYQQFPLVEKIHLADNEQTYEYALHFSLYEHFHGKDDEVNVWLQWCFPGLSIKWKRIGLNTVTVLTDHLTSTVATLEQKGQDIEVSVWGTRPLWSEIVNAYQGWLRTEKPGLEQYTLLVDQQGRQTISIKQREIHSRFTLPDHLERVL
jgi:protein-L-isoaspartate(D-aspartate) O-methyltransferase